MKKVKPKFRIGQVVVLKNSDRKIPTRILRKRFDYGKYWYYEVCFHTGHYLEELFRPLTKRERGA